MKWRALARYALYSISTMKQHADSAWKPTCPAPRNVAGWSPLRIVLRNADLSFRKPSNPRVGVRLRDCMVDAQQIRQRSRDRDFCKPGYEPLDNQSGPQLHIGNLTYKGRVEVFEGLCICTHGFCTLKKECELRAEGYQWFLQIESSLRGLFQGSSTRSRMQLGWLVCGGAAAHRNARGNPASFAVSYADKIRYHSATCQTEPDTT